MHEQLKTWSKDPTSDVLLAKIFHKSDQDYSSYKATIPFLKEVLINSNKYELLNKHERQESSIKVIEQIGSKGYRDSQSNIPNMQPGHFLPPSMENIWTILSVKCLWSIMCLFHIIILRKQIAFLLSKRVQFDSLEKIYW